MAAYRRVYDSHHLQADCQEPGSDIHLSQSFDIGLSQTDTETHIREPVRNLPATAED